MKTILFTAALVGLASIAIAANPDTGASLSSPSPDTSAAPAMAKRYLRGNLFTNGIHNAGLGKDNKWGWWGWIVSGKRDLSSLTSEVHAVDENKNMVGEMAHLDESNVVRTKRSVDTESATEAALKEWDAFHKREGVDV